MKNGGFSEKGEKAGKNKSEDELVKKGARIRKGKCHLHSKRKEVLERNFLLRSEGCLSSSGGIAEKKAGWDFREVADSLRKGGGNSGEEANLDDDSRGSSKLKRNSGRENFGGKKLLHFLWLSQKGKKWLVSKAKWRGCRGGKDLVLSCKEESAGG